MDGNSADDASAEATGDVQLRQNVCAPSRRKNNKSVYVRPTTIEEEDEKDEGVVEDGQDDSDSESQCQSVIIHDGVDFTVDPTHQTGRT